MKDEIKEIERILATSGKYITYAERCYVLDYITNLQEENERLLKIQEMYEKKCNKIHQYITQNCEIIRHKDYDEVGKVNGGHILFLLNGGDEE